MIAVRGPALGENQIRLNEMLTSALTNIYYCRKAALEVGDAQTAREYRKMFTYAKNGHYFDAQYVAKRVGDAERAADFKEIQELVYLIRGPVPRGPPE